MDNMSPKAEPIKSPDPADTPESKNQLIVAIVIVAGLVALGIGLLITGTVTKQLPLATGGVFTIIGGLINALNAPSGIGKVLTAAKQAPQPGAT